MNPVQSVITDPQLTYQQKVAGLARLAEETVSVLRIPERTQELIDQGIICDLFEGHAPYRPRYLAPDYSRLLAKGSEFLGLEPAKDIWQALTHLQIMYRHVPSITTFPVYLGDLDTLLEPFITEENQEEARKAIDLFLLQIDRTLNDSFCHANIGPRKTRAGQFILESTRAQQTAVPNLSLRYDPTLTDPEFAEQAISCALATAKPSFANDRIFFQDFMNLGAENYVIASCYNGLPLGGGSYTLVRLNLKKLADQTSSLSELRQKTLPEAIALQLAYMDERVRFLVEKSNFFESSFLNKEGFIHPELFTAMFGIVGLAEAVNQLGGAGSFGKDAPANELGLDLIRQIHDQVLAHRAPYGGLGKGTYLLHAQVGIDVDTGVSPGCRIPIGNEPDLATHILQSAPFHQYFPTGIGDVFAFDPTMKTNPGALLDIIKGAFASGMRYFSPYGTDCDVVRITGYLVKRSEIAKYNEGKPSLQDTTVLGRNAVNNLRVLDRKVRVAE